MIFVEMLRGLLWNNSIIRRQTRSRRCLADQVPALLRVGYARGGHRGDTGGIFWADKSELEDPLHGFTQIVGHSRVEEVTERTGPGGGKIVFCDCLRNGLYLYI